MIQRFRLCAYTLEGTGLIIGGGTKIPHAICKKKIKKGFRGPEFEALRWAATCPRQLVSQWPRRAGSPASCAVPSSYFRPSAPVGRRDAVCPQVGSLRPRCSVHWARVGLPRGEGGVLHLVEASCSHPGQRLLAAQALRGL